MAVDVDLKPKTPKLGRPRQLFRRELSPGPFQAGFVVSPDGQRFLLTVPVGDDRPPEFEFLVNWPRLLEKRTNGDR
jgi:hypothetical protein